MSKPHQELIGNALLQYTVKTPSGNTVTDIINESEPLNDRNDLVNGLSEGMSPQQLRSFLPAIVAITTKRGHTSKDVVFEKNTLYVEAVEKNSLQYRVVTPSNKQVTGLIDEATLRTANPALADCVKNINAPLSMDDLAQLEPFLPDILNITYSRGHTKESLLRPISDIAELRQGETAYCVDNNNKYEAVNIIPHCEEWQNYSYIAIKLLHAQFRVVLYSLDISKINQEFQLLQQEPNRIVGWTMRGSNFLTRNFSQETKESCSSLAYGFLGLSGLYEPLKSTLSSQTSVVTTPDDLLRHVVAFKEKELKAHPETGLWIAQDVDLSSFDNAKEAYKQVGENANAEDDIFPAIIPSLPRCNLL